MTNPLPPEMFEHYRQVDEANRLWRGAGELERVRTQALLKRWLPAAPATVLDVGGAAGVHALWLAREGYEVHLIDAVPHHVEQARAASLAQPGQPLASVELGDARDLQWPDQNVDAVLLLGPLYHLTERRDRLQALSEARRVLRPGGPVFAAAVSRFASLLDGLSRDLVADPTFREILRQDLRDGQHRNPTHDPRYFTTTFLHHPEDLRTELQEAGFQVDRLIGVEGPVWFMGNFEAHWNDPERRQLVLELLKVIEEDPALLGASAHVLGVGLR